MYIIIIILGLNSFKRKGWRANISFIQLNAIEKREPDNNWKFNSLL